MLGKKNIVFLLLTILLWSCRNKSIDPNYLNNKMWVYNTGLRLGNRDILNLFEKKYFFCRNDTIFFQGAPFAKVISINKRYDQIKLKSCNNDSTGTYIDLNKFSGGK
jgi:hypothetical protein